MVVSPDIALQVVIWGLYAGCIYILLATGLNLIFGVMKIVNFAHGELLMLGAFVTFTFFTISGFNPYVLLAASVPIRRAFAVAPLAVVAAINPSLNVAPITAAGMAKKFTIGIRVKTRVAPPKPKVNGQC